MLALRSLAFDCQLRATQSAALPFGNQAQRTQLSGVIETERGTHIAIGAGEAEVFLLRDHCVVRRADGPWVLRRWLLADGQPLPFIPDLLALCTGLAAVTEQPKERAPAHDARTLRQFDLAVDGTAARELMWSGALPSPAADLDRLVLGLAVPGVEVAKPNVRYELTLSIESDTNLLREVVVRGFKEPGDQGGVGVEFEVVKPQDARKLEELEQARGDTDEDAAGRASVEMRLAFRDFDAARLNVPAEVIALLRARPGPLPTPSGR